MAKKENQDLTIPGNEIDKATAEVIRIAAGDTAKGLLNFSSDIAAALLGDRVREWRTRNMIAGAAKTADLLREHRIPLNKAKALPMGELYEMFDGLSKVDDPSLRDLYAGLLANALDPNSSIAAEKTFTSVLNQLTPRDAAILEFVTYCENEDAIFNREVRNTQIINMQKDDSFAHDANEFQNKRSNHFKKIDNKYTELGLEDEAGNEAAIQNLVRLSCITVNVEPLGHFSFTNLIDTTHSDNYWNSSVKTLNASKTINVIREFYERYSLTSGEKNPSEQFRNIRREHFGGYQLCYTLTSFGRRMIEACTIKHENEDAENNEI